MLSEMNSVSKDGDSSLFQDLKENVPVWGKHVKKLECSNHACTCLRNILEHLVTDKEKENLPKYQELE